MFKTKNFVRNNRKAHGVVEAVHLDANGQLDWVRAYERRGPTWSDIVLLDRAALIQRLQSGKRFYIGDRREQWASEFELGRRLRLKKTHQGTFLVLGEGRGDLPQDWLEGAPLV
ncbi:MAG: hypothetical protein KIT70_01440 [Anaerolineales bacterium]|nr:MAG: hypothetical protein KIT70_01440 [Anaerolineales bacterium]